MKAKQIGFQLLRRIYKAKYSDLASPLRNSSKIRWRYLGNQDSGLVDDFALSFRYLNQNVVFSEGIDWNYSTNGKLWTYNLNYFEFLSNNRISNDIKIAAMRDYYTKRHIITDGMEPYPISLRNINWIKFCYSSGVREFDDFIYSQASLLSNSFEYHLMGNHLLENAFSLLFAAHYFKDLTFYTLASSVLREQLEEQILSDGGHFERSPMYHQIILYRLLDTIHLINQNGWKTDLAEEFKEVAASMLSWISQISFNNGIIPMVNDSSVGIAPTTDDLLRYTARLDISPAIIPLGESGYRMEKTEAYECLLDFGDVGPDYIPGHAHSDTFSFELYHNGEPLIVDTGISTYENNGIRHYERSTPAHNTVQVASLDQSEVWGAFRVASRAKVVELEEKEGYYRSCHDGYQSRLGVIHQREFEFDHHQIIIKDSIKGTSRISAIAYLHFPPNAEPILSENKCAIGSTTIFIKNGISRLLLYKKAVGFNSVMHAKVLEIKFSENLEIRIVV
jgi:hypothetical protein